MEQHLAGDVLERRAAVLLVRHVRDAIPAEIRLERRGTAAVVSLSMIRSYRVDMRRDGAGEGSGLLGGCGPAPAAGCRRSATSCPDRRSQAFPATRQRHAAGGTGRPGAGRRAAARIVRQAPAGLPANSRTARRNSGRSPRRRRPDGNSLPISSVRRDAGSPPMLGWANNVMSGKSRTSACTVEKPGDHRRDHDAVEPASRASAACAPQLIEVARQAGDIAGRMPGRPHRARNPRRAGADAVGEAAVRLVRQPVVVLDEIQPAASEPLRQLRQAAPAPGPCGFSAEPVRARRGAPTRGAAGDAVPRPAECRGSVGGSSTSCSTTSSCNEVLPNSMFSNCPASSPMVAGARPMRTANVPSPRSLDLLAPRRRCRAAPPARRSRRAASRRFARPRCPGRAPRSTPASART